MTSSADYDLLVIAKSFNGDIKKKKFKKMTIGSEGSKYVFNYQGTYSGYASEQLFVYMRGQRFSTIDQDNDDNPSGHCAKNWKGGWWYRACHHDLMNGKYFFEEDMRSFRAQGIHWKTFSGHYKSLKESLLLIKPSS